MVNSSISQLILTHQFSYMLAFSGDSWLGFLQYLEKKGLAQ